MNTIIFPRKEQAKNGIGPLYLRIVHGSQRTEVKLNQNVKLDKWDGHYENGNKTVNNWLDAQRRKLKEIEVYLIDRGIPLSVSVMRDHFTGKATRDEVLKSEQAELQRSEEMVLVLFDNYEKEARQRTKKPEPCTFANWKAVRNHLARFIEEKYSKSDIHISELTLDFVKKFHRWLCSAPTYNDRPITQNRALKIIQVIKYHIITQAKEREIISGDPWFFFKEKMKDVEQTYLTQEELDRLERLDLSRDPRLEFIRDKFLAQVWCACAWVDLENLTIRNIKMEKGQRFLEFFRKKTGVKQVVPISPQLEVLIKKYVNRQTSRLFPARTNQDFNRNLKLIASKAKIEKKLTSHAARRTYFTQAFGKGMTKEAMKAIGGWKNFGELSTYILAADKAALAKEAEKMQKKPLMQAV